MTSLKFFLQDIKVAHSIFAIPFAMAILLLTPTVELSLVTLLTVIVCLVVARSYAMGMNRIVDHRLDAENPRTKDRMIPQNKLTVKQALLWSGLAAIIFVVLSALLNRLAFIGSWLVLVILGCYPLSKRFTFICHWHLGCCLGLTPIAVLVAFGEQISIASIVLGLSITMWTAGFDILYALQDRRHDRQVGLHSVPAHFSLMTSIWISRICFLLTINGLVVVGLVSDVGFWYWSGVIVCALLLCGEHLMISYDLNHSLLNKRSVTKIFFHTNAAVSVSFLLFTLMDYLW